MTPTVMACVIIFATDAGATGTIRAHELAHCNGWQHSHGVEGLPPANFLHPFHGQLYEQPVSSFEARSRCKGMLGKALLGCSTGPFRDN
jgi:hypothetical protein